MDQIGASFEEITNYFAFWRQAKDCCIDEAHVRQLFVKLKERYDDYKSIPLKEFSESFSGLFSGQGVDYCLDSTKEKKILEKLASATAKGRLEEETFVACLKYWTRKAVKPRKALLIVDVQNDFIRGSLRLDQCPAKEDGEEVVPIINDLIRNSKFDVLAYSYDWHPADHCSYLSNIKKHEVQSSVNVDELKLFDKVTLTKPIVIEQILWPDHCLQNSWGAELHKDLRKPDVPKDIVVYKGQSPEIDSYSAFWDNGSLRETNLCLQLMKEEISDVYICGLAFDICVAYTAEDAAIHGFNTFVIENACRSVDPKSKAEAVKKFNDLGIKILKHSDLFDK